MSHRTHEDAHACGALAGDCRGGQQESRPWCDDVQDAINTAAPANIDFTTNPTVFEDSNDDSRLVIYSPLGEDLRSVFAYSASGNDSSEEVIPITLDAQEFHDKEQAMKQIASITVRMQRNGSRFLTKYELMDAIKNGCSWCGGTYDRSSAGWGQFRGTRIIAVDFDNTVTGLNDGDTRSLDMRGHIAKRVLKPGEQGYIDPRIAYGRCDEYGLTPFFGYYTLSASPEHGICRFRLLFDFGIVVADRDEVKSATLGLLNIFPEGDRSCSNVNRIFFGSCGTVFARSNSVDSNRNLDILLNIHSDEAVSSRKADMRYARRAVDDARSSLGSIEIMKIDAPLLALIQSDTHELGTNRGGRIDFHSCPICGHKNCFSYYVGTNSWTCFSSSNTTGYVGGSYIDYVLARGYARDMRDALGMLAESTGRGC